MKYKKLSVDLYDKIMARHRSECMFKTISNSLSFHRSTVASIIVRWKKFQITRTLVAVGFSAKLSNQTRRVLIREVTKNRSL